MTIKKSHRIVLLAAVLFAAGSTFFMLASRKKPAAAPISYRCYNTGHGWGYDILSYNKTIVHQPFIPGFPGNNGFSNEQQARTAAQFVIENIKSSGDPALSRQQLQQIGVLRDQSK